MLFTQQSIFFQREHMNNKNDNEKDLSNKIMRKMFIIKMKNS